MESGTRYEVPIIAASSCHLSFICLMFELPFLPQNYHVLIIEDSNYFRHLLQKSLSNIGYQVTAAEDGRNLGALLNGSSVHLLLVDLILPHVDGREIIHRVRLKSNLPIVVMSASAHPDYLVECLALGADDYLTKPFSFSVMMARLEALLRRQAWNGEEAQNSGRRELIRLDPFNSEVVIQNRREKLTPQEFRFLSFMISQADSVVSAQKLMLEVWHTDCLSSTLISSMVRRLRNKIELDPSEPQFLQTVWGRGYKLRLQQD